MKQFEYVRPSSVAEAVAAGAAPGAVYLAGGTNLLDLMKLEVLRPERVVDIGRIEALEGLAWLPNGGARIGALVRNAALAADARFAAAYPAVVEALLSGASGQVRNMATLAGNLLQQPRCAYFQDAGSACNQRAMGTGCDALDGDNRLHAVLGWSAACIATHPSDVAVPLAAIDAVVEIEGPGGRREVPLETLHPLPGAAVARPLQPGELVVAVRLPAAAAAFAEHSRYLKLRERTSFAFAVVSVAASLRLDAGRIAEARIALGGVAPRPWRARSAEALLAARVPDDTAFAEAAEVALADARAPGGNGFKIELARRIVRRGLALAARGTPAKRTALPASVFGEGGMA